METVINRMESLRVLLLEDSETDAELIRDVLQGAAPGLNLQRVDGRDDFVRALESFSPQVVLSDYDVPGFGGRAALEIVREAYPDLPFLFVSGALGEETAVELLRAGATDYILKDRMSRLPSAVIRALEEARERAVLVERTAEVQAKTLQLAEEVEVRRRAEEDLRKSQKELRRLALELSRAGDRELRRIALEVHDRIGQNLALVLMDLENVMKGHEGLEELGPTVALIDRTIQQTRLLTLELSPPVLYEFGFFSALEWLAERLRETQGLPVSLEFGKQDPLPSLDLQVFLYKTVRELLCNAGDCGAAGKIHVRCGIASGEIYAELESDGPGFDPYLPDSLNEAGLNLFSIREHLAHLGGSLCVQSAGDSSFRLRISLPANAQI